MPRGSNCGALAKGRKHRTDRMLKPGRDECAELCRQMFVNDGRNGTTAFHLV